MHALQSQFANATGEAEWTAHLHALFAAGAFDDAEALLAEALSALDSDLAWTCLELPREAAALTGWDALVEAIALHEGEPVSGVTIAIANDADRAFEKGTLHRPHVLLGLYTDEAYPFSHSQHDALLRECQSASPGWAGREEDIEVHLGIEGLDMLNTALLHHKQRHVFRDGEAAPAPARYVEFVLACWWRALRWHQAVAFACAEQGLPGAVPVIAGMVDMRPDAAAVHAARGPAVEDDGRPRLMLVGGRDCPRVPASLDTAFIQRRPAPEDVLTAPPTVIALRRRMQEESEHSCSPAATGLLARLFGRR